MNCTNHPKCLRAGATALPLLLLLLLPLPTPAQQATSTVVDSSFRQVGTYLLELDGEISLDARIFHSKALGTILVVTEQLSSYVELNPRSKSMVAYSPDDYFLNVDGSLDRLSTATARPAGGFSLDGTLPVFEIEGRQGRFVDNPPLLGPQVAAGMFEHDPAYRVRAAGYQPIAQYVERLRVYPDPVVVKIFFGSWCAVCAELVPRVLSVERALEGSNITFEYYGVERGFRDPQLQRQNVSAVPTGIIYRNGEEFYRVKGQSWRFPSMALHNALFGGPR